MDEVALGTVKTMSTPGRCPKCTPSSPTSSVAKILIVALATIGMRAGPALAETTDPLLVVLSETGSMRDGLPVLRRHPNPEQVVRLLSRGFSGRLLRLYRAEQTYLHRADGRRIEPAYLLLSGNRGGFGRSGFFLGTEDKRDVGYVDLLDGSEKSVGSYGGIDKIFPHELLHIIVEQLAGTPRKGQASQIHEVGAQTDRACAFQEGFAEAMQILAIDDAGATPRTQRLRYGAEARQQRIDAALRSYRTALSARISIAPASQLAFMLWYSPAAQRYVTVRRNGFARQSDIPERLLYAGDPYPAYLLENIMPGTETAPPKSPGRLVSTEGVVSYLLWRWLTDANLGSYYQDDKFYASFGLARSEVIALDNTFLKLFSVLHDARPQDVITLISAYRAAFPAEAGVVDRVVGDALIGQSLPTTPELWLTNTHFTNGIHVFDQYRASPRAHAFDLNAATVVDLVTVPGVDRGLADAILTHGPYQRLDDLAAVPGMTSTVNEEFQRLARQHQQQPRSGAETMDISRRLIVSYLGVAGIHLLVIALCGAVLFLAVRRTSWWRALLAGSAVAIFGALPYWGLSILAGNIGSVIWLLPWIMFALPSTGWLLIRGQPRRALRVFAGWTIAMVPMVVITHPWL